MYATSVSIQRIRDRIEDLNLQEKDALQFLTPKYNLRLHEQIVRLISRIREDKERLRSALVRAIEEGKQQVQWSDLQATFCEGEDFDRGNLLSNVIECRKVTKEVPQLASFLVPRR